MLSWWRSLGCNKAGTDPWVSVSRIIICYDIMSDYCYMHIMYSIWMLFFIICQTDEAEDWYNQNVFSRSFICWYIENSSEPGCRETNTICKSSLTIQANTTKTGRECQRWDSQVPHSHSKIPEENLEQDLTENFCRDPDNSGQPWLVTCSNYTFIWPRYNIVTFLTSLVSFWT